MTSLHDAAPLPHPAPHWPRWVVLVFTVGGVVLLYTQLQRIASFESLRSIFLVL